MRTRTLVCTALTVLVAVPLTACGGSDNNDNKTGGSSSSGIADKSPQEILKASAATFRSLKSYHFDGNQTDKDGSTAIAADVTAAGNVRAHLDNSKQGSADLIAVDSDSYIKADRKFWTSSAGPAIANKLADRWVKAPKDSSGGGLDSQVKQILPSGLARCLTVNLGTITKQGTKDLDGRKAVVLQDAGDKPGTTPGLLWVAAEGTPYVLRVQQTGPRKPGGKLDRFCDDPDSTQTASDVRLSKFNEPLTITAPANPLDLSQLSSGASNQ